MKTFLSHLFIKSIAGCIFLLAFSMSEAQQLDWAAGLGGTANDESRKIAVDGSRNVYVTGFFQGTADFDPDTGSVLLSSQGSIDLFISKYSNTGKLMWAKSIGGPSGDLSFDLCLDSAANIYITGYFQNTVDFDPGPAVFNLTTFGNSDVFVCKLDSSGNFIWARQIGGSDLDFATAITCDKNGSTYTTGYYKGTLDADPGSGVFNLTSSGDNDIFICKLDPMGDFEWAKIMGGNDNDRGADLVLDKHGDVYLTGFFQNTATFDTSVQLTSNGANDVFISKYSSSGQFMWAKSFGGTGNDLANAIAVDASNNVYTAGSFFGSVDFDPNAVSTPISAVGQIDIFIHKMDANGNYTWVKTMGGPDFESALDVTLDSTGNIYSTGYFYDSVDFDPDGNIHQLVSTGNSDVFISKLNSNGDFVSAIKLGGERFEFGQSISIDHNGFLFCSGSFIDTADFDPSLALANLVSKGSNDVFVAKYFQCIDTLSLNLGNDTILCSNLNQSITLDANLIFKNYIWSNSSIGPTLLVDEAFNQQYGDTIFLTASYHGCVESDTLVVEFDLCTSLAEEASALKINIYPNPTSDILTVSIDKPQNSSISIIDTQGRTLKKEVFSSGLFELSLRTLSSGLYFVRIQSDEGIVFKTLVKR